MRIIRLEFTDRKGSNFPWALRLCKKLPSFKETIEDGMKIYSVEFDPVKDYYSIEAMANYFGYWKQAAWFVDGKLMNPGVVLRQIYKTDRSRQRLRTGDADDFISQL
jgi:hypothetical protein